jgi:hypothetical protein
MVKQQVESQIRVADLSTMEVSVHPADYADWGAAAEGMLAEHVQPLKAELKSALRRCKGDQAKMDAVNSEFLARIDEANSAFSHNPLDLHAQIKIAYNFMSA